jgi:DNA modification methylase
MEQKMMPLCFYNRKQYTEWIHLARIGNESCSICDDCTPEYAYKMKQEKRCKKHFWLKPENLFGRPIKGERR